MSDQDNVIDVDRLVEELKDRVQRLRADGVYADELSVIPLEFPVDEPTVRFRPELAYSTKRGVGRALTVVKRGILRLLIHVFDDLARQTTVAVDRATAEAGRALTQANGARAQAAEARIWSEEAFGAETEAREAAERALTELLQRVEGLERDLDRLQVGARLARLERAGRVMTSPAAAPPPGAPALLGPAASQSEGPPLDYLAFEARFRGSEELIRARQSVYRELLAGCRRVVDLGCGRGELVQLLTDSGISAYGVEVNKDFVELVTEKGLTVVRQDALEHLEGLAVGDVDGIVASHVVEHLSPNVLTRLVEVAWERLPKGGVLVMETPNPESLVAGSVNFHRDPTHVRPVHPDTLAFICDSTGFSDVRIQRMSPVPDAERLPAPAPTEGPLAEHLDRVVQRLNALLYGFQDYAVVARR